ncbi:MAG TPA: hypothetical protein VGD55_09775 [Acidothermaceae bacterium]
MSRAVAGGPIGALGDAAAGGKDAPGDEAPGDAPLEAGGLKSAPNDAGAEGGVNVGVELFVHPVSTSEVHTTRTAHAEDFDNWDTSTD